MALEPPKNILLSLSPIALSQQLDKDYSYTMPESIHSQSLRGKKTAGHVDSLMFWGIT